MRVKRVCTIGLDVMKLRKGPTAKARKMRPVIITSELGVLSDEFDHPLKLKVGDVQKLVFGATNNFGDTEVGPFYWSEEDRVRYREDVIDGMATAKLKTAELRAALDAHGVNSKGKKAELIQRCEAHIPAIPTTKEIPNVVREGWLGKPKGVFQILWERGYINPDEKTWKRYALEGSRDLDGNRIKETSLNHLIRKCYDFVNEPTMLQFIGEKLGIVVDRTPKCTPEIAGEGIEYSWAMAKGWYRRQPFSKKKTKDGFHKLVKECVGPEILTVERVRMFSRRAREYMVAYYLLELDGKAATPVNVDHLKKERKRHTEVLDISFAWISEVMKEIVASMESK